MSETATQLIGLVFAVCSLGLLGMQLVKDLRELGAARHDFPSPENRRGWPAGPGEVAAAFVEVNLVALSSSPSSVLGGGEFRLPGRQATES